MISSIVIGCAVGLILLEGGQASSFGINATVMDVQWSRDDVFRRMSGMEESSLFTSLSPVLGFHYLLGLSSSFPDDLEVNQQCRELLHIFAQRCISYVDCLLQFARPVRICQNCYSEIESLNNTYTNISKENTGNVSCRNVLLRSDRLQLVSVLHRDMNVIWDTADCEKCLTFPLGSFSNDSLYFMASLNQTLSCFDKYEQQGNQSVVCKECKTTYRGLNDLYNRMEKNQTVCFDIEDAMNITRRLWSKNFNCSFPREEIVPVIAVSSFMLFLPIIFYLSSFLHSEQKKRRLILPKRAKSSTSVMNIQDRHS
uniref:Osteoclastosis associated transmembrane protein 1 n=1 Tax=Lepisosteus oculatus TaxID=7918 RepID=W5NIP4_LEPOC|nr:PREDICTED: osteopetrosis-associated transmembrane protein 1 [Lepisosteus oculatus]